MFCSNQHAQSAFWLAMLCVSDLAQILQHYVMSSALSEKMNGHSMKNVSVEHIWETVPAEEKENMFFRAQAEGMLKSFFFLMLTIAVALGTEQYWLIILGALTSTLIMPSSTEKQWRIQKPSTIVKYLAARSVAKRYAYGYGLKRLEILLVMRGDIQEVLDKFASDIDIQATDAMAFIHGSLSHKKEVWICLLQSGLVVMSERAGGAKLEFISNYDKGVNSKYIPIGSVDANDTPIPNAIICSGNVRAKNKIVIITSNCPKELDRLNKIIERKKK